MLNKLLIYLNENEACRKRDDQLLCKIKSSLGAQNLRVHVRHRDDDGDICFVTEWVDNRRVARRKP